MHAKRFRTLLVVAATAAVTAAAPALAQAATGPAFYGSAANPIPTHVYAPYVETYNNDDLATMAQQSGVHYETLAFLQTATAGSCTADWNGSTTTPVAASTFGAEIAAIQAHGGNGMTTEYGVATLLGGVRAGRIAPVSREMILNFVAQHVLGQEKSY